jgi:hypothetical protein
MDNISDLLANRGISEPLEIKIIKDYVLNKYSEVVSVKIDLNKIVILVSSSALANSLRMDIPDIQKAIKSDQRITIYLAN